MVTVSVITEGLHIVVLALTPIQRWNAARRFDSSFTGQGLFIVLSVAALILLTVLFIAISYYNKIKRQKAANNIFITYCKRTGLSQPECKILLDIAGRTKLKNTASIFTTETAFDLGAAELAKDVLKNRGIKAGENLNVRLSILREKLGFKKTTAASAASSNKPSSKQIPTGKQLLMTRRKTGDETDIESTVIENNALELTVKLKVSLESKPGELWSVRYYFGASVWEFETSSVSCYGNILVLNHSDNIRFINRRRFLRVPVNQPTFIARFPFVRMLQSKSGSGRGSGKGSANTSGNSWGPPEFVPASVTELAGPGLRIEAPLEVNVGDRVLVIFKLSEQERLKPYLKKTLKTSTDKIVEDIGEVRHTKKIKDGFSIAVELTGLSDPKINELVRITNAASLNTRAKNNAAQPSIVSNQTMSEEPEPAVLQGV